MDLLTVFCAFFTPLLFFVHSHDQFELPKLTLLTILIVPFLAFQLGEKTQPRPTPLTISLFFLLAAQVLSALPPFSLSWRNSLFGDYENFAGLITWGAYLLWFGSLSRIFNESKLRKIFIFNSIAALLSSLYAIAQHFGFDFIQWNPESVNPSREFASLGNPNFLSAYLAMSIPLYLTIAFQSSPEDKPSKPFSRSRWAGVLGLGLGFSILGTAKGLFFFFSSPPEFLSLLLRITGLFFTSLAAARFLLWRNSAASWVGLVILLMGLFSTASRGGFLGSLAGIMVWLFLFIRKNGFPLFSKEKILESLKTRFWAASILLTAGLILDHSFFERLASSVLHAGQSLENSRLHIWRPTLEIIKSNPLLGVGLDNFKTAFPYYSGIEFNLIDGMFTSSRNAHNELLQTAATTGFIGLAAYLGVLAAFGWMWWKAYRRSSPESQWLLIGILSAAVAYHVQNLFSFGVAAINFLWFILLAAVQFFYRKAAPEAGSDFYSRPLLFFKKTAIGIILVLIQLFTLPRLGADIAFSRGNAASDLLKRHDPQSSSSELFQYSDYGIDELKKSINLFPFDVKYQLYLGLAYEQRATLETDHSRDWLLQALSCYQKSAEMSHANAYYYNDEGRVYNALSVQDPAALVPAEEAYRMAVHWAPASPYFILNEAAALEKIGKNKESQEQMAAAFTLSPDFTSKVLSQMAFEAYRSGDKQTAFERINQAVTGDASSPEAFYCRGILYLSEREKKKARADFETVKKLGPTPEKNPSIQNLDQFLEQAEN